MARLTDDVWITRDGRGLDTPEKVIDFMRAYTDQLDQERRTHGAPAR